MSIHPSKIVQVETYWAEIQQRFPSANLVASTLDAFTRHVMASSHLSRLPILTHDIGDSWLYEAAADPIKLSVFREARRITRAAIRAGHLSSTNPMLMRYSRRLLKGPPEHNWGLSIGQYLPQMRWLPAPVKPPAV